MSLLESARKGEITDEMRYAAERERIDPEKVRRQIARGRLVIPSNPKHIRLRPIAIGEGVSTKINSNVGTSPYDVDLEKERRKMEISLRYGADAIMDLSTGGDLDQIRHSLIKDCPVPFGTVPIYQAIVNHTSVYDVTPDVMLNAIERHARQGVDFVTVHAGVTKDAIPLLGKRVAGVVSRGGAFLISWMLAHDEDNPLYTEFDALLDIAREYDLTLSLGDGLRPGAIADNTDEAQIHELRKLGDLTERAWRSGVQVMIEGPGHIPLHRVGENVRLEKEICHGAPFYVLGPLVTDVASGYDHISAAIGAAVAGMAGADFLCYVTPAEHLRLPDVDDVAEGVIALKIAAHAADIAKGIPGSDVWDLEISKARAMLDWSRQIDLSVNPEKARRYRESSGIRGKECTMCGPYCAIKLFREGHVAGGDS